MKRLLLMMLLTQIAVSSPGQRDKRHNPQSRDNGDHTSLTSIDARHSKADSTNIRNILANHRLWLNKYQKILEGTEPVPDCIMDDSLRANLEHVNLDGANLSGADLSHAELSSASFIGADLVNAILFDADLDHADFSGANLTGANLDSADLSWAILFESELKDSNFTSTRIRNIDFRPKDLPLISGLAQADGLEAMRWNHDPPAQNTLSVGQSLDKFLGLNRPAVIGNRYPLFDLRKAMQDANYSEGARKVNAAIHRMDQSWWETAVFDWTCEWGVNYGRPVRLTLWLAIGCSFLYWLLLRFTRRNLLYVVGKKGKREQRLQVGSRHPAPGWFVEQNRRWRQPMRVIESPWRRILWEMRLYWTAALFSLMSVLNLGIQGLDLGRWVRMMHRRDFDLQARGMIRTIAGWQSILSFGLLGLSALGYFGHLIW